MQILYILTSNWLIPDGVDNNWLISETPVWTAETQESSNNKVKQINHKKYFYETYIQLIHKKFQIDQNIE